MIPLSAGFGWCGGERVKTILKRIHVTIAYNFYVYNINLLPIGLLVHCTDCFSAPSAPPPPKWPSIITCKKKTYNNIMH